jgi:RimJ/RimL family protein N-acetyltransferase
LHAKTPELSFITMFSELKTSRLILRRLFASDAEAILAYRCLPEVCRYQTWEPQSLEEIGAFIAEQQELIPNHPGTWFQMAITLKEHGKLIGDCGLHFLETDHHQAEVGISISPVYQGQGYAGEALQEVLNYLFFSLGKHRVYASVDPRNFASIALMEKVGMRKEAHFRQSIWFKGEWADDVIYAVLEDEWKSRQINSR